MNSVEKFFAENDKSKPPVTRVDGLIVCRMTLAKPSDPTKPSESSEYPAPSEPSADYRLIDHLRVYEKWSLQGIKKMEGYTVTTDKEELALLSRQLRQVVTLVKDDAKLLELKRLFDAAYLGLKFIQMGAWGCDIPLMLNFDEMTGLHPEDPRTSWLIANLEYFKTCVIKASGGGRGNLPRPYSDKLFDSKRRDTEWQSAMRRMGVQ